MDKMDLDLFLEKMIELINERLEKQDRVISELRKDILNLKARKSGLDESVLNVLKGGKSGP